LFFIVMVLATALCGAVAVKPNLIERPKLWRLGRFDPFRGFFFRRDGSFRTYGRIAIVIIALLGFSTSTLVLVALLLNK
jgi:hypothetical protein